jgi:hypothetical protein
MEEENEKLKLPEIKDEELKEQCGAEGKNYDICQVVFWRIDESIKKINDLIETYNNWKKGKERIVNVVQELVIAGSHFGATTSIVRFHDKNIDSNFLEDTNVIGKFDQMKKTLKEIYNSILLDPEIQKERFFEDALNMLFG